MENNKSLYDISWQVDESTYRKDSALSYSTLSRYEREGFNNLDKLFDRIETSSLTFGSAVDAIITGGQKEFDDNFLVADIECPDSIITIVKALFKELSNKYSSIIDIPDNLIIDCTKFYKYQLNWKPETRAKVIKEKGLNYYNLLFLSDKKTIISSKDYQDVVNAVDALRDSDSTKWYFAANNPFDNIERLYQLKFKAMLNGVNYRCMADEIICNHDTKEIFLIDLKTSSHTEWDFFKSFVDWNYMIQARLYYRIIEDNLKKDDYFKDFKIHDYRFIVVNKRTLTPLVWEYPDTKALGPLYYGKNKQIECRDPYAIGAELLSYLSYKPKVPFGIDRNKENDLRKWLNTM